MLHRSVGELQATLSNDEFVDWMAEYEISPWGEERIEDAIARGNLAKYPQSKWETWVHTDYSDPEWLKKHQAQLEWDTQVAFRLQRIRAENGIK